LRPLRRLEASATVGSGEPPGRGDAFRCAS
jgi:hypothetical protein